MVILPMRIGGQGVTRAEVRQAEMALRLLPAADIALLARAGVRLELHPTSGVEGGLLGATTILQNGVGPWYPTVVKVATRTGLGGTQSLVEVVQHEIGHAVSVLRSQDTSEAAAERYAQRY